jgi:acyl-CoA dehydrogenase
MDFSLSTNQESIKDAVGKICERFDDAYWLKKDKEGGYPADFPHGAGRCRLARHLHPRGIWRLGLGITDARS